MFSLALVCLLVSRITQKLINQLSQNAVKRQHMGQHTGIIGGSTATRACSLTGILIAEFPRLR